MSRAQDFLSLAADAARKSMRKGHGGPFGAVIARGNRLLVAASNTVLKTHDPTCHAEMNAIRAAAKALGTPFLKDLDIYSTTEPCPMCFSAIHWARLRSVSYATTIDDVRRLGFNELTVSNRRLKTWGKSPVRLVRVQSPDCVRLLKDWTSLPIRRLY